MPQTSHCEQCGALLGAKTKFCPECGEKVTKRETFQGQSGPQAPNQLIKGIDNRILIIAIIVVILVLPIFPRTTIVYVNGTTQTVTNTTSLEVVTQSTESQISVYTGSFQYFSSNYYSYYYNYNPWGQCYWFNGRIRCNYNQWGWYRPNYGTTVTVTPDMNVVNVIRTQGSSYSGYYSGYYSSESLVLVYANGQQSQTYQNVYADNLAPNGVSTVPATAVVTNTIVNPVTQTVPCQQCVPMTVTEYVSILQLLLGY